MEAAGAVPAAGYMGNMGSWDMVAGQYDSACDLARACWLRNIPAVMEMEF